MRILVVHVLDDHIWVRSGTDLNMRQVSKAELLKLIDEAI